MVDPISAIVGVVAVLALLTLIVASVLYGERRAMSRDGVIDADAVQQFELQNASIDAVRQDIDDTEQS